MDIKLIIAFLAFTTIFVTISIAAYKLLLGRLKEKPDMVFCIERHNVLNRDLSVGSKKFDLLTKTQTEQGLVLARIDERLGALERIDERLGALERIEKFIRENLK